MTSSGVTRGCGGETNVKKGPKSPVLFVFKGNKKYPEFFVFLEIGSA